MEQYSLSHQCSSELSHAVFFPMKAYTLPHLVFHGSLDVLHEVLPF
jgi:hypothetical protein